MLSKPTTYSLYLTSGELQALGQLLKHGTIPAKGYQGDIIAIERKLMALNLLRRVQ